MSATPHSATVDGMMDPARDDGDVTANAEAQAAAGPQPGAGLRRKVVKGGMWTGFSFASAQGLAFVSNVVLAGLLARQEFGLMVLVTSITAGLQMFSDIGIGPSLIQNKREDPAFYNTAWTIQVVRGIALWLAACVLAYPLSRIQPDWAPLASLLPVAAFTCVFNGFRSTAWVAASRHLNIRLIAMLELYTALVRIVVMILLAYFVTRTTWALVGGLLVGSFMTCVLSHRMMPDIRNRFHFEKKAFHELVRFGKWLFLSTLITFWAGQIDKFLLGGLLSVSALGLYYMGLRLADLGPMFFKKISSSVGFPALSELHRRDPHRFKSRLLHMRMVLVLPINALLLLMIFGGPVFSELIYFGKRAPYVESGWIVQVICFGSLAGMVTGSYGHVFMATGRSKYSMLSVLAQLIAMVAGTLTGYHLWGETGFILGVGACQWFKYIADAAMAKRCGVWQWKFDAAVLIISAVAAYFAIGGSRWLAETFIL